MLFYRYERTREADDLLKAVSKAEDSLSLTETSDTKRPSRLSSLGVMLLSKFRLKGQTEILDRGMELAQTAFESISKDDPTYIGILNNFVMMLTTKYTCIGEVEHIDRAISLVGDAVKQKKSPTLLNNLGAALLVRYESTGNLEDLDMAISYTTQAVDATPATHVDLPARLCNLSKMYLGRYERTGRESYLESAVSYARKAIHKTPEGSYHMASRLSNLSEILSKQYDRSGSLNTLEEAIAFGRRSVDLTHAGYRGLVDEKANIATQNPYPDLASPLGNLSSLLFRKHMRTGKIQDLDEAISQLREGLERRPRTNVGYAAMLNNLARFLFARYEKLKTREDLDDAVSAAERAIRESHEQHPNMFGRLSNMSEIIFARYLAEAGRQDLEQAIYYAEKAVNLPINNYSEMVDMRIHIGELLWHKYLQKEPESKKFLDQAIRYASKAIEDEKKAASSPHDLPNKLNWLGTMLLELYMLSNADQDLTEAIRHTRDAIQRIAPDDKKHLIPKPLVLRNGFSSSSILRSTVVGLWQGSPIGKRAGSEDPAVYFKNLSTMLSLRFGQGNREEYLNEAIYFSRKAMRATPDHHAELPSRLRLLGDLLMKRYRLTNQQKDLDECGTVASRLDEVLELRHEA